MPGAPHPAIFLYGNLDNSQICDLTIHGRCGGGVAGALASWRIVWWAEGPRGRGRGRGHGGGRACGEVMGRGVWPRRVMVVSVGVERGRVVGALCGVGVWGRA